MPLNSDQRENMAMQMPSPGYPYLRKDQDAYQRQASTTYDRYIEVLPPTSQEIQKATQRDPILSQVLSYCLKGWPEAVSIAL